MPSWRVHAGWAAAAAGRGLASGQAGEGDQARRSTAEHGAPGLHVLQAECEAYQCATPASPSAWGLGRPKGQFERPAVCLLLHLNRCCCAAAGSGSWRWTACARRWLWPAAPAQVGRGASDGWDARVGCSCVLLLLRCCFAAAAPQACGVDCPVISHLPAGDGHRLWTNRSFITCCHQAFLCNTYKLLSSPPPPPPLPPVSDVDNELEELDRQRAQHEQGREDCSRRLQRLRQVGLGRCRARAGAVRAGRCEI